MVATKILPMCDLGSFILVFLRKTGKHIFEKVVTSGELLLFAFIKLNGCGLMRRVIIG